METQEIEVSYEAVDATVDKIWATKPKVVIHVGVAGMRKSIDLEIKSFNGPYSGKDVLGKIRDPLCVDGPGNFLCVHFEGQSNEIAIDKSKSPKINTLEIGL